MRKRQTRLITEAQQSFSFTRRALFLGGAQAAIGAVFAAKGIEMRADPAALALLQGVPGARVVAATEADWRTEFLDAVLAVKTVDGLDDAIAHVNAYGSHHTDAIVAMDEGAAERFLHEVWTWKEE